VPGALSDAEFQRLVREIGKKCFNSKTFWIFCHENPDGDTIGCSLATYAVLREIGKDVKVFSPDRIPRMYRFLPFADHIVYDADLPEGCPEVVMFMDNASFDRVGPRWAAQIAERGIGPRAERRNKACTLINIDHHMSNEGYGDLNLIDPSASACGEIFYHAFRQLRLPITYEVAVNLYATILTDTGRFSYGNTNYQTFQIASELIRLGVNPFEVVDRVYNTRTAGQIKLLAMILDTITTDDELGFFYCYVRQQMLEETGTELSDTEGAVDILKTVGDYDVCFFFKEEADGRVKVSARSNGTFDVSRFAQRFGGGGHPAASGFRLNAGVKEAPAIVAEAMREVRQSHLIGDAKWEPARRDSA
jgi:bifunctional oligoribonuclease and PAP phosphatase NrnA